MVWAMAASAEAQERYLVRDLVWCGLCEVELGPALLATRIRFYGCRNPGCPRPLVEADVLETLVWQAFEYLFLEPTAEVTLEEQRAMLEHILERVTVGADLGQLRYVWRDVP
jgi:hypothetical protein